MKLVKEHINFERGLDPKKAMGIGQVPSLINNLKELNLNVELRHNVIKIYDKARTWQDRDEFKTGLKNIFKKFGFNGPLGYTENYNMYEYALPDKMEESNNFERGLDPKDAMNTGESGIRYAEFMYEKEKELKEKNRHGESLGPIWNWWESYSGDFWEDVGVNNIKAAESDIERWRVAYNEDQKRALIQKGVIQKLLNIDEMPDDIEKWLWPGPNKRNPN